MHAIRMYSGRMATPRSLTLTELFGWFTPLPNDHASDWPEPRTCLKCGAAVFNPHRHQQWHIGLYEDATAITKLNARVAMLGQDTLF